MLELPTSPSNPPRTLLRDLVELLRSRAAEEPEQLAYRFLLDGETAEASLTCGELDRSARAIAALLQASAAPGGRALILCQPGLDYIAAYFGCLYAGVIAVPVYAPHPTRLERAVDKLRSIVRSCRPAAFLTTAAYVPWAEALLLGDADFRALRLLPVDAPATDAEREWQPPAIGPETLAFLQYTSGSTAEPKGVMVSHGNLLHNLEMIRRGFGVTPESAIVSWLPPYHDMGLIGGILQPLYAGASVTLMSPMHFLQRPLRWLTAIARFGATISGGPNFAYDLCVQKCSADEVDALDLRRWQVAFNGAEPIRGETLERFAAAFAGCGFRREAFFPCYGLAEATLMVSCGGPPREERFASAALERDAAVALPPAEPRLAANGGGLAVEGGERRLVGSGEPAAGLRVVVVDPGTGERRVDDAVGEIWVGGPSVAQGYWGKPEESAVTFAARLADGDGPYLRTGDLGFLHGGELFVTGRRKDLIIVRGRNLYPQDVERTVESCHPALRAAVGAAFSVEVGGEERLVVAHELARSQRHAPQEEVVAAIRAAVGEAHDAAVHAVALLKPGTLPKTSSGKVRRRATRDRFLTGELETLGGWEAAATEAVAEPAATAGFAAEEPLDGAPAIARWLRDRVAARLGVAVESIATTVPAARLGLDSLQAVEMTHDVERALGLPLPMETFLGEANLAQLAGDLHARLVARAAAPMSAAPAASPPPISVGDIPSRGQRALWFLHQLAPESAAYNIARALRIRGPLDAAALERAFQVLVDRHPALRTTFAAAPDGPRAVLADHVQVTTARVDATDWDDAVVGARLVEEAERPFDLERGPLLRLTLLARSRSEHLLLVAVHHIVADFWSLALLLDELRLAYPTIAAGEEVALPPQTGGGYGDYVAWQEAMLAGDEGERHFAWWRERLAAPPADLELPIDKPRPRLQGFRGGAYSFTVDPAVARDLLALARAEGVTLYTLLLAAFQTLLHRYTGQTDLVVGSPTTGRSRAGFAGTVGYFVNPLPLRADLGGDPPFDALLRRVHDAALDAFAHGDYPFPLLVERLQPERGAGRHPYFQTMFALQKAARLDELGLTALELGDRGTEIPVGDLTFGAWPLEQRIAQFELVLTMGQSGDGPSGDGLLGSFEYDVDLFAAPTIARLADHFTSLLASIAARPQGRLSSLELLSESERRRVLVEWNDTRVEQPPARLHRLFAAQVARTPDATAVLLDDGRALSYRELDLRAGALARRLRALGVGPEVLVGIAVERSFEMMVGLLGILKAGGAYVPLDPAYPRDQLRLMVQDARLDLLLTQSHLTASLGSVPGNGELGPRLLVLDDEVSETVDDATIAPAEDADEGNLAYVIFTSGSTGRPKGVMATHRGVCNHLRWMQSALPLHPGDRVLLKYSFNFDASVCELFAPLLAGASLLLARPGAGADAAYLVATIATQGVTTLDLVPALLEVLLEEPRFAACTKLRRVVCGGEALSASLRRRFAERCRACGIEAELYNAYGPTEATIGSTCGRCDGDIRRDGEPCGATTPIGRPIANTSVYLLDSRMQPVPVGARGELYIGGVGVARGYLHDPAATAERFVPDPFATEPGSRLYRTGDLGRHLADGTIEYLGRADDQVKIRGLRVEPGEVAAALLADDRVREAVVLATDDPAGGKRLVAYVVPRAGVAAPQPAELRAHLEGKLPRALIPAAYAVLDALPLAPGGKVDRRALLRLPVMLVDGDASYVPPRHVVDEVLAGLWVELLGVPRVGIADDLFALGGHSLLATQLMSRVRQLFGVELPLRALFEAPTVAGLADALLAAETQSGRSEKIARAFQRVQGMSAEEAKRLLEQKRAQQATLQLAKAPA